MGKPMSEFRDAQTNLRGDLLAGVTGQDSGSWTDISSRDKFSIHFILTGMTVELRGSNAPAPLDSDDGVNLVALGLTNLGTSTVLNGETMCNIKFPMRWIKVKTTVWSSGPGHAYLEGV